MTFEIQLPIIIQTHLIIGLKILMKKLKAYPKNLQSNETKKDKFQYYLLVIIAAIGVVHEIFLKPETLGHDIRYTYYIFGLPMFVGFIFISLYNLHLIKDILRINVQISIKEQFKRVFASLVLIILGLALSFFCFSLPLDIVFQQLNRKAAKKNPMEMIHCSINQINRGKKLGASIDFKFQNKSETFKISRKYYESYKNIDLSKSYLEIKASKGLWSYYIVKNWEIKQY